LFTTHPAQAEAFERSSYVVVGGLMTLGVLLYSASTL
jgi:hypothetical protein